MARIVRRFPKILVRCQRTSKGLGTTGYTDSRSCSSSMQLELGTGVGAELELGTGAEPRLGTGTEFLCSRLWRCKGRGLVATFRTRTRISRAQAPSKSTSSKDRHKVNDPTICLRWEKSSTLKVHLSFLHSPPDQCPPLPSRDKGMGLAFHTHGYKAARSFPGDWRERDGFFLRLLQDHHHRRLRERSFWEL